VVLRTAADHALSLTAIMAVKKNPEAAVIIPFNRGAVVPVDASAFRGVRFDIRGDGRYRVGLNTPSGRWNADVNGEAQWRTVEVPFTGLRSDRNASWTATDLLSVEFGGSRAAGSRLWLEIDNVQFY
jgi:hypothetical protein